MARVLLISPLSEQYCGIEDYGAPALGIWRIASFLKAHGHSVTMYDCNLQTPKWFEDVLCEPWDIIGISILADTLVLSLEMLLRVRKAQSDALLVAGGPEAIVNYQEILDATSTDVIALGDGELPMLDMANGVPLGDIRGIIHRRYAVPVSNELMRDYHAHLDFAEMGWRQYWQKNAEVGDRASANKLVRVFTTSHCGRRPCSFCSVIRLREFACGCKVSPGYLETDELRHLFEGIATQLPETTHIYFLDDNFLPRKSRLEGFCQVLADFHGRGIDFLVQTDTDRVDRAIIQRLAECGVVHISFGVENCSPRLRAIMNKPQDSDKIESIIGWCKEFGIRCYYLIILFPPECTIADLWANYRTLSKWLAEGNVGISIMPYMKAYRGTRVFSEGWDFEYEITQLSNGYVVKRPQIILPQDPDARAIMLAFRERTEEYIKRFNEQEGHLHRSKDYTGQVYIELLGDLLRNGVKAEV